MRWYSGTWTFGDKIPDTDSQCRPRGGSAPHPLPQENQAAAGIAWAPYLALGIIFRGPFSNMGDKVGVKLDPGTEGWLLARDVLPFSWSAAAGTACKSGAPYPKSDQGYHHTPQEEPRDSTSTPDKDNYNLPLKQNSLQTAPHRCCGRVVSLLIQCICLDLLGRSM